jgi:hypothetical protein
MLYDDNFVVSLPQENVFEAIVKALEVFSQDEEGYFRNLTADDVFEARALVLALAELHNYRFAQQDVSYPNWHTTTDWGTVKNILEVIRQFCSEQIHSQKSE